jgi:hypothetical protein
MSFICLNVFGPAEGFRAFKITESSVTPDASDQLALPNGELEVSEGAEAFRLIHKRDLSGKAFFELSIFKQVYEQRARRLGHTMGASILFEGSYPGSDEVVFFLRRILDELSAACCPEPGVFGNLESLRLFSETLRLSVIEGLIPAFTSPSNPRFLVETLGVYSQRSISNGVYASAKDLDSTVSSFLSGYFTSIGSILPGRIVFFDPKSVLAIRDFQVISSAKDLESAAIEVFSLSVQELRSTINKAEITINSLKSEVDSLSSQNFSISQQISQSSSHIQQLESKVREANAKYQSVIQLRNDSAGVFPGPVGKKDTQAIDNSHEIRSQLHAIDKSLKAIFNNMPEPKGTVDEILTWTLIVLGGSGLIFFMSWLANYVHSR